MAISLTVLDTITIATPCTVPWNDMKGDERTRFCSKCNQHVHDVSEMTTAEAVELLNQTGHSPCLRIYRRTDGRVMTADCGLSLRERTWKWLLRRSSAAASLFAFLFLSGAGAPPVLMGAIPASNNLKDNPEDKLKTAPPPRLTSPTTSSPAHEWEHAKGAMR